MEIIKSYSICFNINTRNNDKIKFEINLVPQNFINILKCIPTFYNNSTTFNTSIEWLIETLNSNNFEINKTIEVPEENNLLFLNVLIPVYLSNNMMRLYCPECKKSLNNIDLILEHYEVVVDPTSGYGGRIIKCKNGHIIYKTSDWRA